MLTCICICMYVYVCVRTSNIYILEYICSHLYVSVCMCMYVTEIMDAVAYLITLFSCGNPRQKWVGRGYIFYHKSHPALKRKKSVPKSSSNKKNRCDAHPVKKPVFFQNCCGRVRANEGCFAVCCSGAMLQCSVVVLQCRSCRCLPFLHVEYLVLYSTCRVYRYKKRPTCIPVQHTLQHTATCCNIDPPLHLQCLPI